SPVGRVARKPARAGPRHEPDLRRAAMSQPLHPQGTLRARVERVETGELFRRLGVGARSCDLGDQGLYLAEELVAADRWFGGRDPLTLGVLVLALMIARRQGSTCLPLDPSPRGHLR